jgi:hypothetical protein
VVAHPSDFTDLELEWVLSGIFLPYLFNFIVKKKKKIVFTAFLCTTEKRRFNKSEGTKEFVFYSRVFTLQWLSTSDVEAEAEAPEAVDLW